VPKRSIDEDRHAKRHDIEIRISNGDTISSSGRIFL
jgi:hypothetical protein